MNATDRSEVPLPGSLSEYEWDMEAHASAHFCLAHKQPISAAELDWRVGQAQTSRILRRLRGNNV